jgi:hypothetical protein
MRRRPGVAMLRLCRLLKLVNFYPALSVAVSSLLKASSNVFYASIVLVLTVYVYAVVGRAAQESEIPNFKGSDLGQFPLVLADFWTGDHLSERPRRVDAFPGTRARGTLTLKRR